MIVNWTCSGMALPLSCVVGWSPRPGVEPGQLAAVRAVHRWIRGAHLFCAVTRRHRGCSRRETAAGQAQDAWAPAARQNGSSSPYTAPLWAGWSWTLFFSRRSTSHRSATGCSSGFGRRNWNKRNLRGWAP